MLLLKVYAANRIGWEMFPLFVPRCNTVTARGYRDKIFFDQNKSLIENPHSTLFYYDDI